MLYAPDSLMIINNITTQLLHKFKEVYSHETNTRKFKHDLIHEHVIADMQLNRVIKSTQLHVPLWNCWTPTCRFFLFSTTNAHYSLQLL